MNKLIKQGIVDIYIDELMPCLKENTSGNYVATEVFRISRAELKMFNIKTGWEINWSMIPKDVEVYGLGVKGTPYIEGIIGVKNDRDSKAAYIHWACTAPENNIHVNGTQKYSGVGGHLFAIAVDKSIEWGYNGYIHGFASCEVVLNHYVDRLGASYLGMQHIYQFGIDETAATNIKEVYTYEWRKRL